MKIAVLLCIPLIIACKGHKNLPQADTRLVAMTQAAYFPVAEPEVQIVQSQKELKAFFSRVNRTRKPGLPVPDIDFTKYLGLVACLGKKTSTGLATMQITGENDNKIVVTTTFEKDGLEENNSGYPFCVYKIMRTTKEIRIDISD